MAEHVCPLSHRHGGWTNCYKKHKCRCAACRERNAANVRAWRARHSRFDPFAVDLAVDGVPVVMSPDQRAEAVHRLWRRRWSDAAIAAQIGTTARTVLRIRARHGWQGWELWQMEKTMKEAA